MTAGAAGGGGSGIAFDTDNEGDWLFVQANDASGALFGYSIDLRDVSGAGSGIRLKTFLDVLVEAANQVSLLAHNGRVVIESDDTTVYPAEAILVNAPTGTIKLTADGVTIVTGGGPGVLTMSPIGDVALVGDSSASIFSGALIELNTGGDIKLTGLPTVNPGGTGLVWNDAGTLKIT